MYGGDGNYQGSTSSALTQTVNQASSTTTLASSANPSTYGGSVTFTATLTSGATGTVTFKDGTTTLGTGTISGTSATFTTTALTGGSHSITAVYGGDGNYQGSTSTAVSQTVTPASTAATVTGSVVASTYGDSVIFTATVASVRGSQTPTGGTVQFQVDGASLGSPVTLVNGTASLTTAALTGGDHAISAIYGGDGTNFLGSLGNLVGTDYRTKVITNLAGTTSASYSGDGGAATSAGINSPRQVAVDWSGNVYFADCGNNVIRKILGTAQTIGGVSYAAGTIITVAGTGQGGYSGNGGPATAAKLNTPTGVALDAAGNLFIADMANNVVREVLVSGQTIGGVTYPAGTIITVAGTGVGWLNGDGGPATDAWLNNPWGLTFDAAGNLFIADASNRRIREVLASGQTIGGVTYPAGTIITVAGGASSGYSGDGGPATAAGLSGVTDMVVNAAGDIFIADNNNWAVREVLGTDRTINGTFYVAGTIITVAGGGGGDDGGPASNASLYYPNGVALDTAGNLFIADSGGHRIREVLATAQTIGGVTYPAGTILRVVSAGGGYGGDGGLATNALLHSPTSVTIDAAGNLIIADNGNNEIRIVKAVQHVNRATLGTFTLSSSAPASSYGQSTTLTATLPAGATGTVTFKDGTTTLGTGTISGGTASFTSSTLAAGSHSITAVYGGDGNYQGSTSTALIQTVNQANSSTTLATSAATSTYGTAVTFTATVPSGATGTVTFKDGATTLGTGTISGTSATFSTTALTGGSHSITAVYGGDGNFSGSTSTALSQTVNLASSTTTLASSANPSTYGGTVTFTATVTSGATGTVTFKDGTTTLGTGTITGTSATFSTTALTGGSHSITAVYAGDTNFAGSTSSAVSQTVNQTNSTTTVTSSAATWTYGNSVTFSASVSSTLGTPTSGTIQFRVDDVNLGSPVAVVNGSASLSTTALTAGRHTVSAVFSGDGSTMLGSTGFLGNKLVPNNAGFETPNQGSGSGAYAYRPSKAAWTFSGASGIAANGSGFGVLGAGTTNPDGSLSSSGQAAFLQHQPGETQAAWVSQNLTFAADTIATIRFSLEQRGGYGNQSIQVLLDGTDLGTYSTNSTSAFVSLSTGPIAITAGTHTLKFLSLSLSSVDSTDFLDNVFVVTDSVVQVTTAPLTVTANNATRVYGQSDPALGVTYIGFVNGETSSVLGGTLSMVDSQSASNTGVGTYPGAITASGLTASNYTINYVAGQLTVIPKALTMSGLTVPASKTYDGTMAATLSTSGSLAASEAFGSGSTTDGKPYTGDIVSITGTATGTYNSKDVASASTVAFTGLSLTGAQAGNYTLTIQSPASATITAKALTMTGLSVPASKVYSGTTTAVVSGTASLTASETGGTGTTADGKPYTGDTVSITGTATGFYNSKDVDSASTVSFSGLSLTGAQAGNYTLASATTTANITALAITPAITASNKTYDAGTTATIVGRSLTGVLGSDVVTLTGGTATFADKNVATGKTVTATGLSLTGADATNYSLTNTTATTTATITALPITPAIAASNKTYDASTTATIAGRTLTGVLGSDVVSLTGGTATFADKGVATGKTVTATGLSLAGADAGNYTLSTTTVTTTANITALAITGAITASNKTYDAGTSASIATRTLTGVVGSDVVSLTGGTATFADKAAATAKTVTATGLSLSGADAANYSLSTSTATTTANITALAITPAITASNKTYNAGTTATIVGRTLTGVLGTDVVSLTGGTATFANKAAATSKTVTATGLSLTGADAANYTVNSTATTTATITALAITPAVTASNKTYDAGTSANIATRTLSGVLGSDVVSLTGGTATFANKTVATGKTVTATGLNLTGTDAANYSLTSTSATTTANISALAITGAITASNKTYDTGTTATIAGRTLTGVLGSDVVTLSGGTATFATKTVATGKTVTATGLSLTGTDAANYALASTTATTTANITALTVTGAITASNKVYDAGTSATIAGRTLTGALGGDVVSLTGGTATFADKAAATGKTITATGLSLTGTDAANYSLASSTVTTTASITALTVTGAITASNKVYDGTTSATLNGRTLTGVLGGDVVSLTGGTATFSTKTVATGKTVTANSLSLTGADAANYALSSTSATTTANITTAALTATANSVTRVYGAAEPTLGVTYSGFVNGETSSVLGGTLSMADSQSATTTSVGTYAGVITASGLTSSNYTITYVAGGLTITAAPLTVTANNVNRDYGTSDPTLGVTYSGFVNGEASSVLGGTLSVVDSKAATSTPAGTYAGVIMASGLTASNYAISYVAGSLTVRSTTDLTLGGLLFHSTGGAFTLSGNTQSVTGTVQAGFAPTGGASFVPLAQLTGTVSLDTSSLTMAATGAVSAIISGTAIPLLSGGLTRSSISSLVGAGLTGLTGTSLTVAGTSFVLSSIAFASSSNTIKLQGSASLFGMTVNVNGGNYVNINSSGVNLTGVSATVAGGSMSLGALSFSTSNLAVAYTSASSTFQFTGSSSVAVTGLGTLTANLGGASGGSTTGLTVSNGVVSSFNALLNLSSTLAGGSLSSTGDLLTYVAATTGTNATPEKFTVSGSAALTFGSDNKQLSLTLGTTASPGLVIQSGKLTSLNASASTGSTTWSLAGGSFSATGLTVAYVAAVAPSTVDSFALSGTATEVFSGSKSLSLALGTSASPGLVLRNNSLASLNATGTATNWSIASTTFNAPSVNVTYAAAAGSTLEKLTVTGSATLSQTDIGSLGVTLGTAASGSNPGTTGLVLSGGQVSALDLTVNSNLTTSGLTFSTSGLRMVYAASAGTFTLTGASSFSFASNTVNVNFGGTDTINGITTAGLVITNGSLTALDMTVNSSISVGSLSFNADHLRFQEDVSNSNHVFKMSGRSSFTATGLGTVSVLFGSPASGGNLATTGLVITNGSLTSLDMTLDSNINVSGVGFSTTGLRFTYTAATSQFTLAGSASATVGGMGSFQVIFGSTTTTSGVATTTPGLVVKNGSLVNLDMTINSSINVGAVSLSTTGLNFTYARATDLFTLTGSAGISVGGIANLTATFGHTNANGTSTPGLIISHGNLESLDLTINAAFNVSSVAFGAQDLEFVYQNLSQVPTGGYSGLGVYTGAYSNASYSSANYQFMMMGTAYVTIGGIGNLSVSFGHSTTVNGVTTSTPGLTINSGNLESLDVTINAAFAVGGVSFGAQNLEFTYQNLSQLTTGKPYKGTGVYTDPYDTAKTYNINNYQFMLSGSTYVTIGGMGDLSVTFGHTNSDGTSTPGLTINNGNLESLDVTINAEFQVGKVTFGAQNLEFTYQNLSQITSPAYSGKGVYTSVYDTTKTYNINSYQFMLSGSAYVQIGGMGQLSVTFGHTQTVNNITTTTPGLTITSGKLESLDVTVNAGFEVGKVTFGVQDLEFTYQNLSQIPTGGYSGTGVYAGAYDTTKSYNINNYQFMMSGTAYVQIGGMNSLSVTFGHRNSTTNVVTPGLTINNGKLESIDVTINAAFTIEGVSFGVQDLELTYQNLSQLPTGTVYVAGTVFTGNYDTGKSYDINNYTFALSGTAFVQVGPTARLSVTMGHKNADNTITPGLVITNGALVSLDAYLNSTISVGAISLNVKNLNFTYLASTKTFTLQGTASLQLFGGVSSVDVTLGKMTDDGTVLENGITIVSGQFQSLDMTVNSNLTLGVVQFKVKDLHIHYSEIDATVAGVSYAAHTFVMSGLASISVPVVGSVDVQFGGTDTQGLVVTDGVLKNLDMTVNASAFSFGGYTLGSAKMKFTYVDTTHTFTMTGKAGIKLPEVGSLDVELGGGTSTGLVINTQTNVVNSFNMKVTGKFGVGGLNFGNANLLMTYTDTNHQFTLTGSAFVNLTYNDITVNLGGTLSDGTTSQGMIIQDNKLTSLNFVISDTVGLASLSLGTASLYVGYDGSTHIFDFKGTADATLSAKLPGWVTTYFGLPSGSFHVGTVKMAIHVEPGATQNAPETQATSSQVGGAVDANFDLPWTYGPGSGMITPWAPDPVPPVGTQVKYLTGGSNITDLYSAFTAGQTYNITFAAAQQNGNGTNQTIAVTIDGTNVGVFTPSSNAYQSFTTSIFTPGSGNHTIAFTGLGIGAVYISNVSVNTTATQVTPTLALSNPTPFNSALNFTGSNAVALPRTGLSDFSNGFTAGMWVYPTTYADWQRIFEFNSSAGSASISLYQQGAAGSMTFNIYNGANDNTWINLGNVLQFNTWQYLAVTLTSSGQATLYRNGTALGSYTIHLPSNTTRDANSIGSNRNGSSEAFVGQMNSFSVWNTALTPDQVQAAQNAVYTGNETGLVGYWPMNDTTGGVVTDRGPTGLNGTTSLSTVSIANSLATGQPSYVTAGSAMTFDGTSTFVKLPSQGFSNFTNGFSAGVWVYPTAATYYQRILELGNPGGADNITLCRNGSSNDLLLQVNKSSSPAYLGASNALELNKWQYFSVTITSGGTATIYKNGVVVGQSTSTGYVPNNVSRTLNYVGQDTWGAKDLFTGMMSSLSVWNTALTQPQVTAGMTTSYAGTESGLVGFWPLSGPASTPTPTLPATSQFTNAKSFNGSTDYVTVPSTGLSDFTKGFSAGVWVYPTAATFNQRFFDFGAGQAADNIILRRYQTSNDLCFQVFKGDGSGWFTAANAIELNKWQYFAVTINASGAVTLYKNGSVIATSSGAGYIPNNVTRTSNYIGYSNWSGETPFQGKMAGLSVWNVAMTQNQIQAAADTAFTSTEPGLVNYTSMGFNPPEVATSLTAANKPLPLSTATAQTFNGTSDFVTVPSTGLSNFSSGFSAGVWVYPTAFNQYSRLFDFGIGAANNEIDLYLNSSGTLCYEVQQDVGGSITSTQALVLNQWQYVSITHSTASSNNVTISINGTSVATGTLGLPTNVTRTSNYIGKSNWGNPLFTGQMMGMSVWNTALSASQISTFSSLSTPRLTGNETGLVGYWPMNGSPAAGVADISPNQLNGIQLGGVSYTPTATGYNSPFAGSLTFNGSQNFVQLPITGSRAGSGFSNFTNGFSAGVWVYPTAVNNYARLFEFGNGPGIDSIVLARSGTSNQLDFGVYQGTSGSFISAPNAIELNKWQYFSVTITAGGTASMYKNGTLLAQSTSSGFIPTNVTRVMNYVGRDIWGANTYFTGQMNSLSVWNTALTQAQVQAGMTTAYSGSEAGLVGYWPLNETSGSTAVDHSLNRLNGVVLGGVLSQSTYTGNTQANLDFQAAPMPYGGWAYGAANAGWTFNSAGVTANNTAWGCPAAPIGSQVAFIQSNGSMSTTLTGFAANQLYSFSFYAAQRPWSLNQSVRVSLDGVALGTYTPDGNGAYTLFTVPVVMPGPGSHTLTFTGLNPTNTDCTAFISNVSFTTSVASWTTQAVTAAPPVFTNASFEQTLGISPTYNYQYGPTLANSGWTFVGYAGVTMHGYGLDTSYSVNGVSQGAGDAPPNGTYSAFLQTSGGSDNSSMYQTLSGFQPAQYYDLSFSVKARNDGWSASKDLNFRAGFRESVIVSMDGVALGTYLVASSIKWQKIVIPGISPGAGNHTFTFASTTSSPVGTLNSDGSRLDLTALIDQVQFTNSSTSTIAASQDYPSVSNGPRSSYAAFTVTVNGVNVGIQVFFDGSVNIITGDVFGANFERMAQDLTQAYKATAQALTTAYNSVASTVGTVASTAGAAVQVAAADLEATQNAISTAATTGTNQVVGGLKKAKSKVKKLFNYYISDASVYYDPTGTFTPDSQPGWSSKTDAAGGFNLSLPTPESGSTLRGQLVGSGGIDTATGLPNDATFTAVASADVLSPLTTLVNTLIVQASGSLSETDAISVVDTALGLTSGYNVDRSGTMENALSGDVNAAIAFAGEVKTYIAAHEIAALLSGLPDAAGKSMSSLMNHAFWALVNTFQNSTGVVNLGSASVIDSLIQATATRADLTIDSSLSTPAANVIARVEAAINGLESQDPDADTAPGTFEFLKLTAAYQTLADGNLAGLLRQAAGVAVDASNGINSLDATYTDVQIASLAAGATIGNLRPPVVSVSENSQQIHASAGAGQSNVLMFTVSVNGTASPLLPIQVNYSTADLTAHAVNGDYTATSGTLTWAPGDTSEKTISVPIAPGISIDAAKQFLIQLSGEQNAVVDYSVGVGTIDRAVFNSTTTLDASTSTAMALGPVTLKATASYQDAFSSAATGTVSFFDGTTLLATQKLDAAGSASFSSSSLSVGTHAFTATFNGAGVLGASYLASTSDAVAVTISKASQTISLSPIADTTYGATPITLGGSSSQGLPISYAVTGPATLMDGVLIINGAGTVTVTASQAGTALVSAADNVMISFQVAKASLTVTIDNQSMVYGGSQPALSYTITGFLGTDSVESLASLPTLSTVAATSGVGTYAITSADLTDPNYAFTYVPGTLTITPASLSLTVDNQSMVYGGALPALTYIVDGLVNGDTASNLATPPTVSTLAASSNVGTYAIIPTAADPNYTITLVAGALSITPAPLTILVDQQTITYGDTLPTFTVSYTGFVNGDTASHLTQQPSVIRDSSNRGAGEYALTAGGASDSNYSISYAAGVLTINRAALVITAQDQTALYGQPLPTFTASYSGFMNGESASSLTQQPSFSTTSDGSVGTASISATGAESPNYSFSYLAGTLTITPDTAGITLTSSNAGPLAGESVTITALITGKLATPLSTGTVQFMVNGVNLGGPVAVDGSGVATCVTNGLTTGQYAISAVYSSGSTSVVGNTQSINLTVSGVPTTVSLTSTSGSTVYGQAASILATVTDSMDATVTPTGSVQILVDGVNYGSPVSLVDGAASLSLAAGLTAGNHVISVTYAGNSTLAGSQASMIHNVSLAPLTITLGNVSRVYGAADPTPGVTYSGFVNGETSSVLGGSLSLTDLRSAPTTGVGTYAGALTAAGLTSSNYAISYVTGTLTVTPAPLTVTVNSVTRAYGAADPTLNVTYSGLVNNETSSVLGGALSFASSKTATAAVGTYAGSITASGQTSSNYAISYVPGTLTVTKAHLTVSVVNQTKTYDGAGFSGLVANLSGFANGETASTAVSGVASFSGAGLTAVNAGTYTLTPAVGTLAAANYDFPTLSSGTLTITPKALTAAIIGTPTKVYDGTTAATLTAANYSLTGLVGSQSFSVTKTTGAYTDKNVATGLTVSNSLTAANFTAATGTLASNYVLPTTATGAGIGSITARALAVSFVGINKVYDGTTSVAPLTLTDNRVAGDVLSATYTTASFTDKNAGYRSINVSGISVSGRDAANYTFNTTASNPANITQLALTATATGVNKVYDGTTAATVAYTLPGVINGDVVSLTGGTASFANKTAANSKTITVTGLALTGANAANYTVNSTASTTANITKAALTVTATGVNKVADGTTAASVFLSDNRVSGDVFTDSYASASFTSASVANTVAISVTGISISGADAANYTYNTTVSTTANISAGIPAPAVLSQPAAQNVLPGTVASFSAAVSGNPTTTEWQVSTDNGSTWATASGTLSSLTTNGITTSTLSVTTNLANNGQIYRAIFANTAGSVTTNTASLTVAAATISSVGVLWGTKGSATLVTNADGLRLLPIGRTNSIPWLNINRITVTLNRAVPTLAASDIKLTSAVTGTTYSVTGVTGSGTTWTITFANNSTTPATAANGIVDADRVTVAIGNGQLASYTRRLDVLPGDVNDDLAINSLDAAIVKNYYLVGIIPTQALTFLDTDGNGIIDVNDYNLITTRVGKKLP